MKNPFLLPRPVESASSMNVCFAPTLVSTRLNVVRRRVILPDRVLIQKQTGYEAEIAAFGGGVPVVLFALLHGC